MGGRGARMIVGGCARVSGVGGFRFGVDEREGAGAMVDLEKPVARIRRLMRFQRFLGLSVACVTAGALAGVVPMALARFTEWGGLGGPAWWPPLAGGGMGALIAGAMALARGPSRLDAAVAIDREFDLNERLSSALELPADLRETAAGRALLADAANRVSGLELSERFGVRAPRRAWLPLLPAALAAGALLAPSDLFQRLASGDGRGDGKKSEALNPETLKRVSEATNKAIASRREKAEQALAPETAKLLAEIEKATKELSEKNELSKEQALAKVNQLIDTLKEQRDKLGDFDKMSKQMEMMRDLANSGPAGEFAKQLARNELTKASESVKQLAEKLAKGGMSEGEKEQLKKQLEEMRKELDKLANLDERRKQLEEAKKNGALSQEQFDQEMSKLDQQAKKMEEMKELAEKLGKAAEAMERGDTQAAAEQLGMTQQQIEQMAASLAELETLDAAMADLADMKNGLASDGSNALGDGSLGRFGMGNGDRGQGSGQGRGRGEGDRPIAEDDTAAYDTRVKQQLTRGKGVVEGLGPRGQQTAGQSELSGQATAEVAESESVEALANQRIPSNIRKHVQGYFEQINSDQ